MLLQCVVADLINGFTKNDIILKFANKGYNYQKKAIGEAQAKNYIKMAYLLMAEDRVEEQDKLRDQLYGQYLMLYNDFVVNNNGFGAKQVLDSIAKLFLNDDRKQVDVTLDKNNDKVRISFGFNDGD